MTLMTGWSTMTDGAAEGAGRTYRHIALLLLLAGCATQEGRMPRVATVSDRAGFKMLKPEAEVEICRGSVAAAIGGGATGLLDEAFRRLVASDDEADSVLNARVRWRWRSVGLYGWQCVALHGDVVRAASTVVIPMVGDHGGHEGH